MATLQKMGEAENNHGRTAGFGLTNETAGSTESTVENGDYQPIERQGSQQRRHQDMRLSGPPGHRDHVRDSVPRQGGQHQQTKSDLQSQPQSPPMVVDLQTISNDVISLLESVRNTPETNLLWAKISMPYRFLLMKTTVFKFAPRPVVSRQEQRGGFSAAADFFIRNLGNSKPGLIRDLGVLAGLRCSYCLQSPQYVPGATNFVALCQEASVDMLVTAMDGRRRHFLQCPWAPNSLKQVLGQQANPDETAQLRLFLSMWHDVVKQKHFAPTVPVDAEMPSFNSGSTYEGAVERAPAYQSQSIKRAFSSNVHPLFDEDEALSELDHSFSVARKFCFQRSGVVFEDLTDLPTFSQVMETPSVEMILQSFSISFRKGIHDKKINDEELDRDRCQQNQPSDETEDSEKNFSKQRLFIHCRFCKGRNASSLDDTGQSAIIEGGALEISKLLTGDEEGVVDKVASNLMLMGESHYRHCKAIPRKIRDNFAKSLPAKHTTVDRDIFLDLLPEWKIHLRQTLLPRGVPSIKAAPDADLWGAAIDFQLLSEWAALSSKPLLQTEDLAAKRPHGMVVPDVSSLGKNDVVVEDEFLRDLEGNRRYRKLISEHREFYLDVGSPEQEQVIVETLANVIQRRGGNFFSLYPLGPPANRRLIPFKLTEIQTLEYVTHSLDYGFPDLLRPPIDLNSKGVGSRCSHIEHAPLVGRVHQSIRWMDDGGAANDSEAKAVLRRFCDRNIVHLTKSKEGGRSPDHLSCVDTGGGENADVEEETNQSTDRSRRCDMPVVSPVTAIGMSNAAHDSTNEPIIIVHGDADDSSKFASGERKRHSEVDGQIAKRARIDDPFHGNDEALTDVASPTFHDSLSNGLASKEKNEVGKENFPYGETTKVGSIDEDVHEAGCSMSTANDSIDVEHVWVTSPTSSPEKSLMRHSAHDSLEFRLGPDSSIVNDGSSIDGVLGNIDSPARGGPLLLSPIEPALEKEAADAGEVFPGEGLDGFP